MLKIFKIINEEIENIFDKDPAVKSKLEVILCYPGFQAIMLHRISHFFYRKKFFVFARIISHISRFFTGIEIHPGAKIGKKVFIDHGMGVVIGETAIVGNGCLLYKGAVLGGVSLSKGKRHPTLGENVVVGTNAIVLGNIKIGNNAKIAAGSVVLKNVPHHATVVGIPGKIVKTKSYRSILEHNIVPDPFSHVIHHILNEIKELKEEIKISKKK